MFSMFRAKLNLTGSSLSANSVYQFPPSLPSLSSLRRLSIRVRKFDDGGLLSSSRPFRNPNWGVTRILHLNSNHSIIIFRYLEPFSLSIVHLFDYSHPQQFANFSSLPLEDPGTVRGLYPFPSSLLLNGCPSWWVRDGNLDLVGWLRPHWLDVSFRENFASFPRGWEAKSTIPYRWRRRLASACAEDPGIASWGDRWRMTMMIVSISVCSGHIQLSTTTVYLEGSRFDIWPFLIWREPVVAAPVHGRLWRKLIAQLDKSDLLTWGAISSTKHRVGEMHVCDQISFEVYIYSRG